MRSLLLVLAVACGSPEAPPAETPAPTAEATADAPVAAKEAPPAAPARDDAKWKYFGEPFTVAEAVPAKSVFGNPEPHADKPVRVVGELSEVCQKAGCWAVVRDGAGHSLRIKMKDHAFGIDKDTRGKACDVEGQLVSRKVDPEELAHFESEGAKDHPEAGKTVAWELVASSVAVAR